MKTLLPAAAALLLAACAGRYDPAALPQLPPGDLRWYQVEQLDQEQVRHSSLLAVQGMADGNSRWIHSDALGAPLARLLATPAGWQRDGFLPPNRRAERLFAALFAHVHSGDAAPYRFEADGLQWRVSRLATEPNP